MTDAQVTKFYSGPNMSGGDLPYFVGKQYGSGWLKTLGRFAFPLLRKVANVALNTGQDVVQGRDWKESLRDNTMSEVGRLIQSRPRSKGKTSINKRKNSGLAKTIFANKRRRRN